ncbi:MAG: ABC transporter permease [Chloroflexi bacterium]|nr:MAG: ABC transporter permease [Chloroflexota bacterium]
MHHSRPRAAAWPRGREAGRGRGRRELTRRIRYYGPAVAVFVGVLGLWELAVRALGIQQFLLPPPSSIGSAFAEHFDELITVGRNTLVEAVGGLLIGGVTALVVAFATARWATASRALLPFAIAANSVPIIAFAPIMNNWFGILNPLSKMMVVAVLVFFPIMINTLRGLTLVDQASLELMRSYAANELAIFAKVRVPNALPYIFTAFKVSATLSLIGAIVAEYFGGSRSALGQFIITEAAFFRFANAWAAIVVASVVSIAFFLIIVAIERVAIPWHSSARIADSS